jgi:GNAT superfamily N-acetyltransferase
MAIEIKLLAAGDDAVLQHIAPGVFDDPIHPARAAEFLADPRHHLACAIDDGVVVGFASAVHYVHPDKPAPELWINEVSVAATHRRRGLATRLLRRIFEQARTLGGYTGVGRFYRDGAGHVDQPWRLNFSAGSPAVVITISSLPDSWPVTTSASSASVKVAEVFELAVHLPEEWSPSWLTMPKLPSGWTSKAAGSVVLDKSSLFQ